MRFRTTLVEINVLTRIIQTIHKVSPRCLIRLENDYVRFICTAEPNDLQIWSQISVDRFFREYKVESNFGNQINFEVNTDTLLQALKSAQNAEDVLMRLAKRDKEPLLSFAIANKSVKGARLEVVQDILIRILRPTDAQRIKEPLCPDPDIHINLPKLYKVRAVAERMKAVSKHVTISANRKGEFTMSIEQTEVSIRSTWKNCGFPAITTASQPSAAAPVDLSKTWSVKLEARALLKFLSSHIVEARSVASICENHCAILYVYVGNTQNPSGVLTFYLPGVDDQE